ncbi:hypothetical protein GOQ29_01630 [Clostridium sp. D2Q-14]|uniref:hypothetical protein n=1 Tax=Anaeromonas gelatinilytica TaxID=2683194 RepID=UPI00193AE7A6|nr:hypothetical protein [Anaeromonas gelatinilytica]MBS4534313.1 hypothetical protein [Anaeromonas gelatinilytica]
MKLRKPLLVFFIVIIITSILLFSNDEINTAKKLDKDYLIDKLILQSELDIYSESNIELTEEEFNGLVIPKLMNKLNSKDIFFNMKFENLYLYLNQDNIKLKGKLKNIPSTITMDITTIIKEDKIYFDLNNVKIGKLPIPKLILNPLGLSKSEKNLYIDNSNFNEIDIVDININDNNLKIIYKINNDKAIEKYIDTDQKEFINDIVILLEDTEESRSLANNIIKAILLTNYNREIPIELINTLKNDFTTLDNKTKTDLIFTIIKYNVEYILNILR